MFDFYAHIYTYIRNDELFVANLICNFLIYVSLQRFAHAIIAKKEDAGDVKKEAGQNTDK